MSHPVTPARAYQPLSQPCPTVQDGDMARKRTQASSNTAVSLDSQETEPKITASHDEALPGQEGKVILTEDDCPEALATSWSTSKKWLVLTIIFLVQLSSE